ncbi:M15 family metallopeptidase [Spongisporangium articulatum]|uniref:M15 family metallopeptidase n=1 Tax=Spongisporangium articulatum TaxID=3362603 RepID=A0ABW8AJA1_9ACTN
MTTSPIGSGRRVLGIVATAACAALALAFAATLLTGGSTVSADLLRAAGTTSAASSASPTSSTSSTSASPTPSPAARPTRFTWTVSRVSAKYLGKSWHAGCPVGPRTLRHVAFTYWGFDGERHRGVLVLHHSVVKRTRTVFRTLYQERFPMRSVRPVSYYGGSDDRSMAADNTSAFNCRKAVAAGAPSWSLHAYGKAIDVNPVENPYLFDGRVLPPNGKGYVSRKKARPGLIRRGDPVYDAFRAAGYRWGGSFSSPDYQHFDR